MMRRSYLMAMTVVALASGPAMAQGRHGGGVGSSGHMGHMGDVGGAGGMRGSMSHDVAPGLPENAQHRTKRQADDRASTTGHEHADPNAGFTTPDPVDQPGANVRDDKRVKRKAPDKANDQGITRSDDDAGLRSTPETSPAIPQ